jgi:ABC-type cobalamin/Fe3+-siderophores transport system ATPase subunit
MSKPITHITQVEIQQLWKEPELNIKWNLHRDVNILAGDNGSGKSTILNLILWLLARNNDNLHIHGYIKADIKSISIMFNESSVFTSEHFKLPIETLEKNTNKHKTIDDLLAQIKTQLGEDFYQKHRTEDLEIFFQTINGQYVDTAINNLIQVNNISTFDEPVVPLEYIQKFEGKKVKTYLDSLIANLEKVYLDYQVEIGKLALKALSSGTDIEQIRQVNQRLDAKKNLFLDMIDELFGATQKRIDRDNNGISFIKRGKTKLGYHDLSSGEKQMLMILLTALVQNNKPTVMIMDEPELSLHTDWQEKLIDYIRQLNENVQIIIATHSPSIVINGWQDKVFEIDDILVK